MVPNPGYRAPFGCRPPTGGITGAAGLNVGGNAPVGNAPGGINDFLHRKALTVAQIKGIAFPVGCKTAPSVSSFDQ
ncbi:protein of unknown function [Acidithiobacillus ferrivorans]|uniref:Uncharacterized protein n=1 Tax=Acidithiobacillus ferrivorans TaxID=160808 RepID=A0A060UXR5_9PROT|nr:hypothetical protein AFERRI_530204 [Acidithiobacillus ferrivorans]SMH67668.1 protein of unknown function [Acidithiobacillus ferrivorans]